MEHPSLGDPYPTAVIKPVEENQEPLEGWPRNPIFNGPGDVPGPPVQFGPPIEPDTVKPGEGFTGIGLPENDIFYFHPDHLGSTSYITTRNGSISQHVEYIAFGEVLFEEHSSSFSSPYLFNGKELDRETNLSYYGARYLDMKTSLWLSVDVLAEEYFNIGGYTYCTNNPINFIDPDGRRVIFIPGLGYEKGNKSNGPYAENISNALTAYTGGYGTSSQTVDGSHGLFGDMLHVMFNAQRPASTGSIVKGTRIYDVANGIAQNIIQNPLAEGEQMNVMGFSQGSVTTAQAIVDIFRDPAKYGLDENFKIDNLILGGSPVAKDSELYAEIIKLQENGKIGKVVYDDAQLKGDKVTGLGGTSRWQALKNGWDFVKKMVSPTKRANDPHAQAAQDEGGKTTNFVIDFLKTNEIH